MQTAHISLVTSKATQQRWRERWRESQEGIRRLWDQCVSFNFHTVKGLCNNRAQMGGGEPTSACWCTGAFFFFLGLHGPTVSYWIKRAAAEVEKWWRTPVLYLEGKQLESFTFDWQKIFTVKYIQSYSIFFFFGEQERLLAENKWWTFKKKKKSLSCWCSPGVWEVLLLFIICSRRHCSSCSIGTSQRSVVTISSIFLFLLFLPSLCHSPAKSTGNFMDTMFPFCDV